MSTLWHKVWHDVWAHKARTLLAMFSISLGVFSVGAIFGMVDQLLTGMDAAHQAVAPSHFNIILRGVADDDLVADLRALDGVADIDPVNQLPVRYRTSATGRWEQGNLVQRPEYANQTYDQLRLIEGTWPTSPTVGQERLTSQYFEIVPGSEVIFDIAGTPTTFTTQGLIRHPFVQPPAFGGRAHFFVDAATLAEFGIPAGRYVQLLVRITPPYSRERAETIAGDLRAWLGEAGVGVAVTIYQDPDKHWGRMFVEGIMLVLQVMAVVSLFLSVVLVMNTMTALITQQTDQIGVLKAVGGRRCHIVAAYLPGVVIYGVVALALALPTGMLTAFYATQAFLNLFNVDYATFQFSTQAVMLQVLTAVLAPVLAGLAPVWRGAAMSVREAIATYGLGGDFGATRFDRALEQVGARFLPTVYAASLGNLFRRKSRLVLTGLVLTTGGVSFLVVMSLISSVFTTIDNDTARRRYDVRVGFTTDQAASRVAAVLAGVDGIALSETWLTRNATLLRANERLQDSAGLGAQLVGVNPASDLYRPLLTAGRWLTATDERVVVMSQDTASANRLAVGDVITLSLGDTPAVAWEIVGTYKVIAGGGFVTEELYAPLTAVEEASNRAGRVSRVLVRASATERAFITQVADDLRAAFEADDIKVDLYTSAVTLEERDYTLNQFAPVVFTMLGVAYMLASVGAIGLASSLSISVMERTREIGVLRAIGASSATLMRLYVAEGVLQSWLSWLVAVPLAYGLAQPLAELLGQTMLEVKLDYAFDGWAVLIWLATMTVMGLMASLGPAWQAARLSVRESLAYT